MSPPEAKSQSAVTERGGRKTSETNTGTAGDEDPGTGHETGALATEGIFPTVTGVVLEREVYDRS